MSAMFTGGGGGGGGGRRVDVVNIVLHVNDINNNQNFFQKCSTVF